MNDIERRPGDESSDLQEVAVVLDQLGEWQKTVNCDSLRSGDVGREVVLMGWVQRRRDHGGLIFVDLRDREGLTQVVFDPNISGQAMNARGLSAASTS